MWAVNHKYCLTLCFQIFHLWAIVLSHKIPSFYISFTFLFYICSFPFFHLVVAALVFLSFSFSFPSFLHIYCFFFLSLFFFHLFTLMLLWVLLYFFMGLFVFESVGFVWAYEEEGETAAGLFFMGCVFLRWLGCVSWVFKGCNRWIWVVGSGRRRSGSGFGSGSGSSQVQQLWVSSENSWEFFFGISLSLPGIHLPAEIAGFCWHGRYEAGTASIFSDMKQ